MSDHELISINLSYRKTIAAAALLCASIGVSEAEGASPHNLADLSLEELANITITSVSKRTERLSDAAASVFVITAVDIRRSGVTSLPEALRLAPNLHVAQANAAGYAISARGFNNNAANKLLVMIDGRSVYTPLFSGVFWDVQDVMLEDVERIEVISGPGGTLWGANAVNGVINVVMRATKDTQGTLVSVGGGNREANVAVRHGGAIGADGSYRIYGKYLDIGHTTTANGTAKDDALHKRQIGFRADWARPGHRFMVHGNAYNGSEGQPPPGSISISGVNLALDTIALSGVNLTARWESTLDGGSSISLQGYFDRTQRTVPPTFAESLNIIDLQFQHSLRPAGIHAITWGAEYRYGRDRLTNSEFFAFLPAKLNQTWTSVFAEDEMALRDNLEFTLGVRLDRNDYTGMEFLPNARLAWKVSPDHLLWTAASRTVRAPSRLDRDAFIPGSPPFLLAGGPNVRSEVAKVYELGYRGQPTSRFTYSVTAFHADYDHLRTQEIAPSGTFIVFANEMEGTTHGVEMWGTYQASPKWRLSGGWSGLRERLRLKQGSNDTTAAIAQEGRDPAHRWMVRAALDLLQRSELDVTVRRVSALSNPTVPAYLAVDFRYGWNPRRGLELSITGQNLTGSGHGEFNDVLTRSEIQRSVFFKIVSRF